MSEWRKQKLGAVVLEGNGKIHTGPFGSQLHASDYVEQGIPCIMPANMNNNRVDLSGIAFISKEDSRRLSKYLVQAGDIVYSRRGDVTQKALIKAGAAGYFCGTGCLLIRPGSELDSEFLTYFFSTGPIKNWIVNQSIGGTMPTLNTGILKSLPLCFPKKNEQSKIAAVLSALDAKIELNNRINGELEAMAKTLYDFWFVQFDFPNANGQPYKSSGGKMVYNEALKRDIPEGWFAGTASAILEFNPTLSLKKIFESSYIDMNAIPTTGYMTKKVQVKKFGGGVKFQNGDVVVARITPCLENGKTGLITLLDENEVGFGSTEFIVMRGRTQPLSAFAACLARSEYFRKFAILNMTGTSGRKRVDANILETISLPIPPDDLLGKFEDFGAPLIKQLTANTKETQQLTELRDFLLPMLMNGQVQVG